MSSWRSSGRCAPRGRATCRPGRATAATRLRRGSRGASGRADRHRPHRRRPGRDDPLPARLLAEPPGPAGDAAPRRPARSPLARRPPARRRPPTASSAACSWRDDAATRRPTYARNRIRAGLLPELAQGPPGRRAERAAHRGAAARGGRAARRARRRRARRLRLAPARHDLARAARRAAPGAAPARRPAARRRRRRPAGRRRRPPRRGGRRPAPHRHAMLDLGSGVRAVAERGVLRAEQATGQNTR